MRFVVLMIIMYEYTPRTMWLVWPYFATAFKRGLSISVLESNVLRWNLGLFSLFPLIKMMP